MTIEDKGMEFLAFYSMQCSRHSHWWLVDGGVSWNRQIDQVSSGTIRTMGRPESLKYDLFISELVNYSIVAPCLRTGHLSIC